MYSVACVDDERPIIEEIKNIFQQYEKNNNISFEVDEYTSSLAFNFKKKYDCIFLDIEMDRMDGLTLATKIRNYDENVLIVFITHLSNLAIEGYKVHAFDFIVKPIEHNIFLLKIDRIIAAIKNNEKRDKGILINTADGMHNVNINSVLLVESDKHYLNVYLDNNEVLRVYGKLNEFKDKFDNTCFALSGKSYLVNLSKISKITSNDIILENKKIVPMTRQYKEDFLNAFTVFASGE